MGEASAQKVAAVAAERDEAKQQLLQLCADQRSGLIDPPPPAATPEGLGGLLISTGWCGSRGGAACGLSG